MNPPLSTETGLEREPGSGGLVVESSEVRFRKWMTTFAWIAGPLLLLLLYKARVYTGLTSPDAMDYAQIARNMAHGHGMTTSLLRPLALTHGTDPLRQPDVTHGPLYPFVLAIAIGAFHAKDLTISGVSALFYLLTIPVLFNLGRRCFNAQVGAVACLVYIFSPSMLERAFSGTLTTFLIFLTTALLLSIHRLAAHVRDRGPEDPPRGPLVVTGLLAAALYLTEIKFILILPVVLGIVSWLYARSRGKALLACGLPVALLALPWMIRNAALGINPIFGLRSAEAFMGTTTYPEMLAYRMLPTDFVPGVSMFKEVVKKLILNFGGVWQTLFLLPGSWILTFFLPSLFFGFRDPAPTAVRRTLLLSLLGLSLGVLLYFVEGSLFFAFVPGLLVFAVAYLQYLFGEARMSRPASAVLTAAIAGVLGFPLLSGMFLQPLSEIGGENDLATALTSMTKPNDVILSDQPWMVAWRADRPSCWVPRDDATLKKLFADFPTTRAIFLTQQLNSGLQPLMQPWPVVYNATARWNADQKAIIDANTKVKENAIMSAEEKKKATKALRPTIKVGGIMKGFEATYLPVDRTPAVLLQKK